MKRDSRKGKQGVSCQPPVIPDRVKHWLHVWEGLDPHGHDPWLGKGRMASQDKVGVGCTYLIVNYGHSATATSKQGKLPAEGDTIAYMIHSCIKPTRLPWALRPRPLADLAILCAHTHFQKINQTAHYCVDILKGQLLCMGHDTLINI